jgi:hypothetical protein
MRCGVAGLMWGIMSVSVLGKTGALLKTSRDLLKTQWIPKYGGCKYLFKVRSNHAELGYSTIDKAMQ